MKRLVFLAVTVAIAIGLFSPQTIFAAEAKAAAKSMPGTEIAQTISMITGVAISPLLGVSAVGAWKYFAARTPEQKARLPWFAHPLFLVPALLLVAACFVKDTLGTAAPTALKKPFDVAEAVENKVSGLVAAGAFVPIAASIFHGPGGGGASLSSMGFAAIDLHWLYNGIMVPVSMAAFVLVFLASNAINILILISPFTTVDAALKAFRLFILSTVTVTAFANPWIGAAWALIIIGISYLIAGWSFRMSVFGTIFIWDFVTRRRKRFTADIVANKVFLGRKINKVPVRTYGTLCRDGQGNLVVKYRPWLVLPERILTLPEGKYEAGRGMFYSEILRVEGDDAKTVLLLPPRYRGHEDELVKIYGFAGARDIGLRAAWQWFKGLFGFKSQPQAAPA